MGILGRILGIDALGKKLGIERTPEEVDDLVNEGNSYLRKSMIKKAINIYKEVLDINPAHAVAWNNLGAAYIEYLLFKKAIEACCKAVEISPEYADAWFNLGNAYFRNYQYNHADDAYTQAIHISPEHHSAKHNRELCRKHIN
jgi:tetratricopeptide (TPR) repeat protein